jgi:excisionase family DNA binding protein
MSTTHDAKPPQAVRQSDQLLDIDQVADLLSTTTRHIRRLVFERRIPYVKVGRYVRFDPGDLAQWVEGQKVRSEV